MWSENLSDDTTRSWAHRVQRGVASHEFQCAELDEAVWPYVDDPRAEKGTCRPRILRYIGSAQNQGYNQHVDNRGYGERDRLVSLVVMLSDPSEYEGGALWIKDYGEHQLPKGSVIVFPSNHLHGVGKITAGFRYVANYMWVGNV
jgi:predicted 2-oxoglutarate/Fe(II)-dependent dioxygenase YbiX